VQNVGIVNAESPEEAEQKTLASNSLSQDAKRHIQVYELNDICCEWWYYR
jgi:hypothetical protein